MPEINRHLNNTKVAVATQTGFSMAKTLPIEFDMLLSRRPVEPQDTTPPKPPKNCAFLQIFHYFYVLKLNLLVLTKHLVNF